jgi:hypothetical protein
MLAILAYKNTQGRIHKKWLLKLTEKDEKNFEVNSRALSSAFLILGSNR